MDNPSRLSRKEASHVDIPICEIGEPLVSVSNLSSKIKTFPYYYQQNIPNALPDCYVRQGVAERLVKAANLLPADYWLVVLDGWRPYQVQQALYQMFKQELMAKGLQGEVLYAELAKFVARPSKNPDAPSPHITGGAVDLTIANNEGWLEMGTDFDELSEAAHTSWFETKHLLDDLEQRAREHRRLLTRVMSEAGFVNYEKEWWHYEYGNQRWALKYGQKAIYKGILHL
ncbi:M15 family metallopeptidase [Aneurinibacillus terranovensis]|uniref:M15 family metallopeptidase n=1 Tax=Aneurinibacillus terranovensis TaxID=278991 RepID=UPI0004079AA0|nr:M15 family metallopeptidase [Aneurinibacillus terranovensis]